MDLKVLGEAGVASGWRAQVADRVAPRVGRSRAPITAEQARAALGLAFLAMSVYSIVSAVRRYRRRAA